MTKGSANKGKFGGTHASDEDERKDEDKSKRIEDLFHIIVNKWGILRISV